MLMISLESQVGQALRSAAPTQIVAFIDTCGQETKTMRENSCSEARRISNNRHCEVEKTLIVRFLKGEKECKLRACLWRPALISRHFKITIYKIQTAASE